MTRPALDDIAALLMELFAPAELTAFLANYEDYAPLGAALPDPRTISPSNFFRGAVALLDHRKLLDQRFAERLSQARPLRAAEIDRVLDGSPNPKRVIVRVQEDVSARDLRRILETIMAMTSDVIVEVMGAHR